MVSLPPRKRGGIGAVGAASRVMVSLPPRKRGGIRAHQRGGIRVQKRGAFVCTNAGHPSDG